MVRVMDQEDQVIVLIMEDTGDPGQLDMEGMERVHTVVKVMVQEEEAMDPEDQAIVRQK